MALKNLFKNSGNKGKSSESENKQEMEESNSEKEAERAKVYAERKRPDPSSTSADDLYPFGMGNFDQTAPDTDASHICNSKVVCPVCGEEIIVVRPLTANLHLKTVDNDLRRHYKDFEPIWYDIWNCPHCYYTALYSEFDTDIGKISFYSKDVIQAMKPYKEANVLAFSVPRTAGEVITSMYMAIRCAQFYDCKPMVVAKIWLHLSWLYKDLGEEEFFIKASEKALEEYKRGYYEAREEFKPIAEQTCFLVMGELNILLKNYRDAYDCLVHSKLVENGNRLHKMNAQNRIEDVRELMHQESE